MNEFSKVDRTCYHSTVSVEEGRTFVAGPVESRTRKLLWIGLMILGISGAVTAQQDAPEENASPEDPKSLRLQDVPLVERNRPVVPRRPFRDNARLPSDANLVKKLDTVEDLLSESRWNEAIRILQDIAHAENKSLVLVRRGTPGGVATYLNVATRCNVLLSRIPKDGRESYRRQIDPQAKRWFENWQRTRDPAELLRIVHQAFLSSYGDDALMALGEECWDRGEFATARSWWLHLIPLSEKTDLGLYPTILRYPDADLDQASILARIVMCSILEQDFYRAEQEIRQFSERYATDEGWLGGRQGILADRLQEVLEEAKGWPQIETPARVETFAMSPARDRRISDPLDVGALRWGHPLLPNLLQRPVDPFPFQDEPLSYFPVVFNETVLVNDSNSIRAWNLLTGEPAFQTTGEDPAAIYPSIPDETGILPDKMSVGVPFYTMSIWNGRLYARMGSPVTCPSNQQQRDLTSDLVCLDLAKEGKLIWKLSSREIFQDEGWRFEGSPLVVHGRAYVTVCRRHPQLELMVICMDAVDGRLLWRRSIGGFRSSVEESVNRVSHLLLTAGGGRLFLSTDAGAIIALNEQDGRLEWAITYESRLDESMAVQSDPTRKGLLPPLYYRGLVFVAPNDSDYAYCIRADSGQLEWKFSYLANLPAEITEFDRRDIQNRQRRENQWHHLLGVARGGPAGRLIVSGRSLWAIDINDGSIVWTSTRGGTSGYGRGVLAGDQIYLPGRDTIEIVSQMTGELSRRIPLKTPDSSEHSGNLTIAGGTLLVAQSNRLSAYCEYSVLKERIERELTLQPDSSLLLIQLADIESAEGNLDAATNSLELVLQRGDRTDPNDALARRKLATLLQNSGNMAFNAEQFVVAAERWSRAYAVAEEPSRRIDLLFDLARVEELQGNPEAAVRHLQAILDDEQLAGFPREFRTVGQDAIERMNQLLALHGRDAYRSIEAHASQTLAELSAAANADELKQFIQRYPHAEALVRARQRLAEIYRDAGDVSEAYAILNEFRRDAADERAFASATIQLIELLEKSGLLSSAARLTMSLESIDPSLEIDVQGTIQRLGEVLENRRLSDQIGLKRSPSLLGRTWSLPISIGAQVVIPDEVPPASHLDSFIVSEKSNKLTGGWSWRCLSLQTGSIRWEVPSLYPAQVASWTDVHLLIGTPYGWEARSIEHGRRIWFQPSPTESTPFLIRACGDNRETQAWPAEFDPERGFRLFDPDDGQVLASVKPPGRLSPVFGVSCYDEPEAVVNRDGKNVPSSDLVGSNGQPETLPKGGSVAVMMQTVKPTRTWLATARSLKDRWTLSEISTGGEPWRSTPTRLNDRVVGIDQQFHLVSDKIAAVSDPQADPSDQSHQNPGAVSQEIILWRGSRQLQDRAVLDDNTRSYVWKQLHPNLLLPSNNHDGRRENHWNYRNFSSGQTPPVLWSRNGHLCVIADGSLLMGFNPLDGQRKWSTGLADFPVEHPDRQVSGTPDMIYAASQGTLRGLSLVDGAIRFEKYLGEITPQWQTEVLGTPRSRWEGQNSNPHRVEPATSATLVAAWPLGHRDGDLRRILICDSETGQIAQSIRVNSDPKRIYLSRDGHGVLWTENRLMGLQAWVEK